LRKSSKPEKRKTKHMQKAVVKIKGHQYLVFEGQKIKVQKMKAEPGDKLELKDIFLVFSDSAEGGSVSGAKEFKLGKPVAEKSSVEAKVLRQARSRKLTVFKYGPKTRRRVKRGFRAEYTEIEITSIK